MHLTIAIPTYNRNAVLKETLEHFLPQLEDRCKLLLVDNHSDVPVEESLRDLLAGYPRLEYRIVRNRVNIGGAANILRCFELCDTEWMWLFGDDDHPALDGVSTVLRHLDFRPDCAFFNFASDRHPRGRSVITAGLREFVRAVDSWPLLLFMSVGVYHCPTVLPNLRYGYLFAYSFAPHLALVLTSLGDRGACCFSHEQIIQHQAAAEWSQVNWLLGKMTLLDLPMEDDVRRELAGKLRQRPSLEATAVMLVKSARQNGDWREAVYQYDQICARVYYHDRRFLTALRIFAYRLLVRFPAVGYRALRASFPVLARATGFNHVQFDDVAVPDRFQRA